MTDHIRYDDRTGCLVLLDQRALPSRQRFVSCRTHEEVISAIRNMTVRGAPAIGVAGAWACVLAARNLAGRKNREQELGEAFRQIQEARPTAVNLVWAVKRMEKAASGIADGSEAAEKLLAEAVAIQAEDIAICERIGAAGAGLIQDGDSVLTHCNAGALATAGYGTALGVIRAAIAQGKKVRVIADETRPLLQGARLTAFELAADGIPVTVACDNACATILGRGMAQLVITGADRIAANGDTANKIGNCGVAIIARHFAIPFYIAAPVSTIDIDAPSGEAIPIEQREAAEVTMFNGERIAPEGVGALNFAFDVTPADLIDGIITERGILRPPYSTSIAALFEQDRM